MNHGMHGVGITSCGPYSQEHDLGDITTHEERGVLVITHGKRAGRIYATEQSWTEQTCKKCNQTERLDLGRQSHEWPGGIR